MIDFQRLLGFASVADGGEATGFRNAAVGAKIGGDEDEAPARKTGRTSRLAGDHPSPTGQKA